MLCKSTRSLRHKKLLRHKNWHHIAAFLDFFHKKIRQMPRQCSILRCHPYHRSSTYCHTAGQLGFTQS